MPAAAAIASMLAEPMPCSANTRAAASNSFSLVSSRVGRVRSLDMPGILAHCNSIQYCIELHRRSAMPDTAPPSLANSFFRGAMSPAFREDPYPYYERFRGPRPLLQVADTIWFAMGHADVTALLRHPKLSTDESHATAEN